MLYVWHCQELQDIGNCLMPTCCILRHWTFPFVVNCWHSSSKHAWAPCSKWQGKWKAGMNTGREGMPRLAIFSVWTKQPNHYYQAGRRGYECVQWYQRYRIDVLMHQLRKTSRYAYKCTITEKAEMLRNDKLCSHAIISCKWSCQYCSIVAILPR